MADEAPMTEPSSKRDIAARLRRAVGGGHRRRDYRQRQERKCRDRNRSDHPDTGRHLRRGVHPSGDRRAPGSESSGPTPSACVSRCATWRSGSPLTATPCSCRTRTTGSRRRRVRESADFNFANPADATSCTPLMGSINADGAAEKDAAAFVAWLDAQKQVDTSKKIGTQGYCMGGAARDADGGGSARIASAPARRSTAAAS